MPVRFVFIGFILVCLLWYRFATAQKQIYQIGRPVSVHARLLMMPEQKGRNQSIILRPHGYEPLYISAPLFPEYQYGDVLTVTGTIKASDGEKIFYSMSYPDIIAEQNDSYLYRLIAYVRINVSELYQKTLPQTGASLLMGIVFGIKQGMPEDFQDGLAKTGVTHVVAASGMNVTLVAAAFMTIFGAFLRRQTALIVSIFGIFSYAFLAGMEPSILRASLMGSLMFVSGILGRQAYAIWSLIVTGYVMLFVNPQLITDVGFQLSFMATLGILVIKPLLPTLRKATKQSEKKEGSSNEPLIVEDLKTTLAAQLGTVPILLSAFGQVSLLSLLVNMLVLWTIPLLMFIGVVSALAGMIMQPLGMFLAVFALPFLWYFESVVMFFAQFDYALHVEEVSLFMVAVYYGLLLMVIWFLRRKKQRSESTQQK